MIIELARQHADGDVVVVCRSEDQVGEFSSGVRSNVFVPATPVDGVGLSRTTDIFVGMGGTMTIESALLGLRTVSAYWGPTGVLPVGFLPVVV
jgi:predicted glycosyltransferase